VVVECKETRPAAWTGGRADPQYANSASEVVRKPEALPHVQLTVVTSGRRQARHHHRKLRSTTCRARPDPLTRDELGGKLARPGAAHKQEISPRWCSTRSGLEIVHNYVTFMVTDEGRPSRRRRFQQFRAVERTCGGCVPARPVGRTARRTAGRDHLAHPGLRQEPHHDVPGRKLRSTTNLKNVKVVMVTDARSSRYSSVRLLELTGETVDVAKNASRARAILGKHDPAGS